LISQPITNDGPLIVRECIFRSLLTRTLIPVSHQQLRRQGRDALYVV